MAHERAARPAPEPRVGPGEETTEATEPPGTDNKTEPRITENTAEPPTTRNTTETNAAAAKPKLVKPTVPQSAAGPARRSVAATTKPDSASRGEKAGIGQAPWVLAISSLGVALVALGYAGGRYENRHAILAYWTGQVVVFVPVVARLLSRRLTGTLESFALVIGLAVNQYLLKWFYSPDQFRFPDELQHWLATTNINESGELFRPNLALPPAVNFPGLAQMGAAVSQLTGLPVTAAGILVAAVAHLCFVGGLYMAVLRASRSPSVAGVCCVVYATALHYLFFSSMYLYQTAALTFFMLAVWAMRRWRSSNDQRFALVAVAALGLTTMCHHVTAFALVATLFLLAGTELLTVRPRPWRALLVPSAGLAVVALWILLVARDVIYYLLDPLDRVSETAQMILGGRVGANGAVSIAVPLWQLAIQGTGMLGLLALYLAVGRDMRVRKDRDPWRWAAMIGAGAFFIGNGVRFLGADGPELAGRLSTFTYVPMSIVAAYALVKAVQVVPATAALRARRLLRPFATRLTPRLVGGVALLSLLLVGARVGGWPPVRQLLPGPYRAAAFERSVDQYGLAAADWQRTTLGPGQRVGGDATAVALSSTYGRQNPVREVAPLFYSAQWTGADEQLAAQLGLSYLVVDHRLTEFLPADEAYFEHDPHAGRITAPLTVQQVDKFDALPHWSRLYDNGQIRIYRVGAL